MNKVKFIFSMVEAGYTSEQCQKIEDILYSYADLCSYSVPEIRDAAKSYLFCCRDIDKLGRFLSLSEEMNRDFAASWEDAYKFVLDVVCGWCK